MRKNLNFYLLGIILIFVTSCNEKEELNTITNIVVPQSSSANPISVGSSVTIKGNGFTEDSGILLSPSLLNAAVEDVTSDGITFTVPNTTKTQTVIHLINGIEQTLGEIYLTHLPSSEIEKLTSWGLVSPIGDMKSHNRKYEWYIDQGDTGIHRLSNCGPASSVMVLKWDDENFSKTVEDARAIYKPDGEWWSTLDIAGYLTDNGKSSKQYEFNGEDDLKTVIDAGGVAILCLDISYVTEERDNPDFRIHKFYESAKGSGHYIVVKGYIYSNNILYFEVYDPWSLGEKYDDGQYKGEDRYYLGSDLYASSSVWWKSMIVVSSDNRSVFNISTLKESNLPPQWGR